MVKTNKLTEDTAWVTYQLIIQLTQTSTVVIGKLGSFCIEAGMYTYTGSAKQHLEARIARHLRQEKTLHWHIDYLLASSHASILEVMRFAEEECIVNQRTLGKIVIPKFGASDCKVGCGSHLKYTAPIRT